MLTRTLGLLVVLAALGCRASAPSQPPVSPSVSPPSGDTDDPDVAAPLPPLRVRVGSWNIRRLGQAKTDLALVAGVLAQFDIVAVQEVMNREVVDALHELLPEHRILLTDTPRPTTGTHREYYGFVYRPSVFDPVMNTFYPDPDDAFVRDPYIACFDGGARIGTLCLLTVHIVWGDRVAERKAEILAVDDALSWGRSAGIDAEWLVLGDFNRPVDDGDRDTDPELEWQELLAASLQPSPMVFVGSDVPTTLGESDYANAYDHCFVSAPLRKAVRGAGRFDLVGDVCDGSFERCRASVSDHAPYSVRLEFR